MQNARVLVVGGLGRTGRSLIRQLLAGESHGHGSPAAVRILSRSATEFPVSLLPPTADVSAVAVDAVQGDVGDREAVRRAMRGITHVAYCVMPTLGVGGVLKALLAQGGGSRAEITRHSYVEGLRNVLAEGQDTLCHVTLLSARSADKPWRPSSMMINAGAGMSQLYHVQQERLLRTHAAERRSVRQRRAGNSGTGGAPPPVPFGYTVFRPPILGSGDDAAPEAVGVCPAGRGGYFGHTRVTRAGMARLMVEGIATAATAAIAEPAGAAAAASASPVRRQSLELWSEADGKAPAGFDWAALLASVPNDDDYGDHSGGGGGGAGDGGGGGSGGIKATPLPPPEADAAHAAATRLGGGLLAVAAVAAVAVGIF